MVAFASMGAGLHQRTFQALLNVAVFGMTVDQAVDAPDFFLPSLSPKAGGYLVMVPKGRFPQATLDGLGVAGAGAHTLEEHIIVDSLAVRARLMAGLLATLA